MAEMKSFIMFCDRLNELEMLTDEQAGRLMKALFKYVSAGEVIPAQEDVAVKLLFSVMKSSIDENNAKYDRRCEKNRQIAIEREQRKREQSQIAEHERAPINTKSTYTYTDTYTKTNTYTDTYTDNNILTDIIKCGSNEPHSQPKRFIKPSLEEVEKYCKERNNNINPKRFYDHYESNGWKVGKNPMKDWKATVRKWESNEYSNSKTDETESQIDEYKKVINQFLPL